MMAIFGFVVGVMIMLYITAAWAFIAAFGGFEFSPAKVRYTLPAAIVIAGFWWLLISNSPFTIAVN